MAINQEVLASLEAIDGGVGPVREVMAEIAAASEQQTQGVEQINARGGDERRDAADGGELGGERSAAEELPGQADGLRELVGDFRLQRPSSGGGVRRSSTPETNGSNGHHPKPNGRGGNDVGKGSALPETDPLNRMTSAGQLMNRLPSDNGDTLTQF